MRYKAMPVSIRSSQPTPMEPQRPAPRRPPRTRPERLRDWLLTVPLIVLLPVAGLLYAPAYAGSAEIAIKGDAVAGGTVRAIGQRFPSGKVALTWDGASEDMPKATVRADGSFSVRLRVPASAEAGTHVMAAITVADKPRDAGRSADAGQIIASVEVEVEGVKKIDPKPGKAQGRPKPKPTAKPRPTRAPDPTPAQAPAPTPAPTVAPTIAAAPPPTAAPTVAPTIAAAPPPTAAPTVAPTIAAAPPPTAAPTVAPTLAPAPIAAGTLVLCDGQVFDGFSSAPIKLDGGVYADPSILKIIRNCTFRNGSSAAILLHEASNVLIENNLFINLRSNVAGIGVIAVRLSGVRLSRDVTIRGNTFDAIGADGIQMADAGSLVVGIVVEGNRFYGSETVGENAIDVKGVLGPVYLRHNTWSGFRPCETGQDCTGSSGPGIVVHEGSASGRAHGVWITGNTAIDNVYGINVSHADQITISGNTLFDSQLVHIRINDVTGCLLGTNTFMGTGAQTDITASDC